MNAGLGIDLESLRIDRYSQIRASLVTSLKIPGYSACLRGIPESTDPVDGSESQEGS